VASLVSGRTYVLGVRLGGRSGVGGGTFLVVHEGLMVACFCNYIRSSMGRSLTQLTLNFKTCSRAPALSGIFTDWPDLNIILECVAGSSFHEICHTQKNKQLSEDAVKGYCLQLSDIMCYVHSRDVVHRDLKPSNVLVSTQGIVKLIDFGLAHVGDTSKIPKSNIMAGTPVYLPPEVLREERVTNKLDVYSFGLILWELLARDLPFQGMSLKQMIAAVSKEVPCPPTIPLLFFVPLVCAFVCTCGSV